MVTTKTRHGRGSGSRSGAATLRAGTPAVSPQSGSGSATERAPRPAGEALAALVLVAVALTARALTFGNQFAGDALGHLDQSGRVLDSLDYLLLDTWTRPLPNLLFAAARVFGVAGAFVVPVGLTVAATWWLLRTLEHWFPGRLAPLASALLVLLQLPVLDVGCLTMTEVPCYAALALALMWFTGGERRRPLSYLALGCLPLCRPEALVVTAVATLACLWSEFGRDAWARASQVGQRLLLAAAPLGTWLLLGLFTTGDLAWYLGQGAYGSAGLRGGPLLWWVVCNAATVLPRLLPVPLLLLLLLGAVSLRRHLGERHREAWVALLPIPALSLVFTVVRTGPERSDAFHAAGLARMYATLMPCLTLVMAAGLLTLLEKEAALRKRVALVAGVLLLAYALPLDLLERAGAEALPDAVFRAPAESLDRAPALALVETLVRLAVADLHAARYVALALLLPALYWAFTAARTAESARAWLFRGLEPDDFKPWLRAAVAAGAGLLGLFLFPFSVHRADLPRDETLVQYECLQEFGAHYRQAWLPERREVVQHYTWSLARFCGVTPGKPGAPRMPRYSPGEYRRALAEAPAGTLFLVGFTWGGHKLDAALDPALFTAPAFRDASFSLRAGGHTVNAVVFEKAVAEPPAK